MELKENPSQKANYRIMENPLRHTKGHIDRKRSYLVIENLLRHTTGSKDWMIIMIWTNT